MRYTLIFVAALLAGCGGGTAAVTPFESNQVASATPTNPPAPTREIVTVKGSGISSSKPFHLAGNYLVNWIATPKSSYGCYHGASLKRTDGTFMFETIGNEVLNSGKSSKGETNLYNLDDADYYIDASSGCKWVYTFTPDDIQDSGSVPEADYEAAVRALWADASAAASEGNLSAALWEIRTSYPGSLDPTKSEKCARASAASGSLGSIISFTGDFTSVLSDPGYAAGSTPGTDELSPATPLAGEVFSMMVTLTSKNGAGVVQTSTDRVHFASLNGMIYRFPKGFCY